MKYLGNIPDLEIIDPVYSRFDYIESSNPTTTCNPDLLYVTWLNTATGELFHCIDNTTDSNEWVGTAGTSIS